MLKSVIFITDFLSTDGTKPIFDAYKYMNRFTIAILSFFVSILFIQCTQDPYVNNIDPAFVRYFDSFIEEGLKRSYPIDLSTERINASFRSAVSGEVGQCVKTTSGIKNLYFDPDYWQRSDPMQREFLVYHELGHCILGRSHDDGRDGQGRCISIMNSGTGNCRSNYISATRDSYLDELFLSL
jgi:hypothetical protein